jgi:RHS repeat-associated protein
MLDCVGLVHLNGRVYDPVTGRMTSADPMVPDPLNGQTWNRYSYVGNNPLAFTDPTGYCFLGLCNIFNSISTFFNRVFNGIEKFLQRNSIVASILKIVGAAITLAICGPTAPACLAAGSAITSGIVDGVASGSFDAAIKSAAIAGLQALAFYEIGDVTNQIAKATGLGTGFLSPAYAFNVGAHALVGCVQFLASGGKCGAGALAGAIPAAAGPFLMGLDKAGKLLASSTLGGLAAVAGGGKFANDAVTGAFGYLFNSALYGVGMPGASGFQTADAAAIAVLQGINPLSIYFNVEYGGLIYRTQDGLYGYTARFRVMRRQSIRTIHQLQTERWL